MSLLFQSPETQAPALETARRELDKANSTGDEIFVAYWSALVLQFEQEAL